MPLGIDHLKSALKTVLDLSVQLAATKKFNFWTIFSFIDDLAAVGGVVTTWKDIVAEFKDLDETEKQELYAYAQEQFDIPNDQVESFVEDSLQWVLTTVSLVERAKTLKK